MSTNPSQDWLASLEGHAYLNLGTFRKDGREVRTPVWFARGDQPDDQDVAYAFTMANSGKVKRLRNFSRSTVAACDMRGKPVGAWFSVETHLIESPDEQECARKTLRRKYRLQMAVTDLFGHLTGRIRRRAYLKIQSSEAELGADRS